MNKNLLNPTPPEKKERNRLWAEALKKNKKKALGIMLDENGGRCCLRVAEDLAVEMGVEIDERDEDDCNINVYKFFGWEGIEVRLMTPSKECGLISAVRLNDSIKGASSLKEEFTHDDIAECVLNTFVESKPVWSEKLKKKFDF